MNKKEKGKEGEEEEEEEEEGRTSEMAQRKILMKSLFTNHLLLSNSDGPEARLRVGKVE